MQLELPSFDANKYIERYKQELSVVQDKLFQTETILGQVVEQLEEKNNRIAELEEKLGESNENVPAENTEPEKVSKK